MGRTNLGLLLEEDERANEFSEEYFQELYKKEKEEFDYDHIFEEGYF